MRRGRVFRNRWRRKVKASVLGRSGAPSFCTDGSLWYNLLKWMGKENFKQSKKMKPYIFEDTGRGILAEETIHSGDIVISIPESLLIRTHVVFDSPLGLYIKRWCPDATGHEILSVYLMCEKAKGKESFWYPYIAVLPSSYTIPAYCNSKAVSAFPTCVRHLILKQINLVKNSFEKMKKLFISLENSFPQFHGIFRYDCYLWAWSTVNTRCVYIECEGHKCKGSSCSYHLALAPFLDLLNHHYDVQVEAGFNAENRCYEIKSLNHFKKHSQVFINYGNHCNRELFVEYGFVMENNFNDVITVSSDDILSACKNLKVMDDKLLLKKKQMLLSYSSELSNLGFCKDGLTWGMDMVLKILCTKKAAGSLGMLHDMYLSKSEESAYRKFAKEAILVKLKDYACLLHNENVKPNTIVDVQTQIIFNIFLQLYSLEQNVLLQILQHLENSENHEC